jgi:hypothetical protein
MKMIAVSGHETAVSDNTRLGNVHWRGILPLAATALTAICPAPPGLPQLGALSRGTPWPFLIR